MSLIAEDACARRGRRIAQPTLCELRNTLRSGKDYGYTANVATDTLDMNPKMEPSAWLLMTYKVPAEPSKLRVGIWRRIRGLGAVYLQNSVCVLPTSADHQRQLRMVQSDIEQGGGEAVIFETTALDAKQEELVVARFKHDRDQDYEEFLDKCADFKREVDKEVKADHYTFAELKENDEDLKKLKVWLEKVKALDFYGAPARGAAEQQLSQCEELLDAYAQEVYEREQNAKGAPLQKPEAIRRSPAGAARKAVPKASRRAGKA